MDNTQPPKDPSLTQNYSSPVQVPSPAGIGTAKWVIGALIIVVLGAGAYLMLGQKNMSPQEEVNNLVSNEDSDTGRRRAPAIFTCQDLFSDSDLQQYFNRSYSSSLLPGTRPSDADGGDWLNCDWGTIRWDEMVDKTVKNPSMWRGVYGEDYILVEGVGSFAWAVRDPVDGLPAGGLDALSSNKKYIIQINYSKRGLDWMKDVTRIIDQNVSKL